MEMHAEPSGSGKLLDLKVQFARQALDEMKADYLRQNARHICGQAIALSIAVAGIVLSIYGGVFAENSEGIRGIWTVLWGPGEVQEIQLSELMKSSDPDNGTGRSRIYVLALDVSASMLDRITKEDWEVFVNRIKHDRLEMCAGTEAFKVGMNRWDMAQAQACCYLKSLKDGDYVALWKFGASASSVSQYKRQQLKKDASNGVMVGLDRLQNDLMALRIEPGSVDSSVTNFEELLDQLHKGYMEDSDLTDFEIHFVVFSDFVHDLGPRGSLFLATSMQKVADRFHDIGKVQRAMFHLVAVKSASHEVNSVIPVAENAASWYQYRFDSFDRPATKTRSMPDFFYGFTEVSQNLTFYHMAGSASAGSVRLVWEDGVGGEESLLVGLMTDVYGASDEDLALYVAEGWPTQHCPELEKESFPEKQQGEGEMQTAILRPKGRQSFQVKRSKDYVCIQPLSVEQERIYKYKLTLSRPGQDGERTVYLVDIEFRRYLPPLAAWTLIVCFLATLAAVVYWGDAYRRSRPRPK